MKPPEEPLRDLVRQRLAKAEEDYALADHLVSEGTPWLAAVGFHCQQAAEKLLKALLVRHQVEFPKTHALGQLLDLVATLDPGLAESLREATRLNPYGVETRYPSEAPGMTAEDARAALALAARVRNAIRLALLDCLAPG